MFSAFRQLRDGFESRFGLPQRASNVLAALFLAVALGTLLYVGFLGILMALGTVGEDEAIRSLGVLVAGGIIGSITIISLSGRLKPFPPALILTVVAGFGGALALGLILMQPLAAAALMVVTEVIVIGVGLAKGER